MAKYRNKLSEMLENGELNAIQLAGDLLGFLSEADCEEFANNNCLELFPEEDEEEEDND